MSSTYRSYKLSETFQDVKWYEMRYLEKVWGILLCSLWKKTEHAMSNVDLNWCIIKWTLVLILWAAWNIWNLDPWLCLQLIVWLFWGGCSWIWFSDFRYWEHSFFGCEVFPAKDVHWANTGTHSVTVSNEKCLEAVKRKECNKCWCYSFLQYISAVAVWSTIEKEALPLLLVSLVFQDK